MSRHRTPTRRSFLSQVAGGGLLAGAGLIFGAKGSAAQPKGQPTRQMVVDADPRDPARPPAPAPAQPGPTDRDSGPNGDPGGQGAATNVSTPRERFVICPGNSRCPR